MVIHGGPSDDVSELGLVRGLAAMTASYLLSWHCHAEIDQLHLADLKPDWTGLVEYVRLIPFYSRMYVGRYVCMYT